MSRQLIIRAAEEQLGKYGPGHTICPVCRGGSSREQSLSVYYGDDGMARATCHRASCPTGTVILGEERTSDTAPRPRISGPLHPLTAEEVEDIQSHYLAPLNQYVLYEYVRNAKPTADVAVQIRGMDNLVQGYILRNFYPQDGQFKARTKLLDGVSYTGAWFTDQVPDDWRLFIVEDPFSAMALMTQGYPALCLGGTNVRLLEHAASSGRTLYLMLDADATRKALRAAQRYIARGLRVIRLERDVKDMTTLELAVKFDRYGVTLSPRHESMVRKA